MKEKTLVHFDIELDWSVYEKLLLLCIENKKTVDEMIAIILETTIKDFEE